MNTIEFKKSKEGILEELYDTFSSFLIHQEVLLFLVLMKKISMLFVELVILISSKKRSLSNH